MYNIIVKSMKNFMSTDIKDDNIDNTNNYVIGIHSNGWIHSIPVLKKDHKNLLNVWFEDVEKTGLKVIPWFNNQQRVIYAVACSKDQAIDIFKFIKTIPPGSNIYIYCAKGQSRSVAVANFIRKYFNKEHTVNASNHNNLVYKLLEEVYNESQF